MAPAFPTLVPREELGLRIVRLAGAALSLPYAGVAPWAAQSPTGGADRVEAWGQGCENRFFSINKNLQIRSSIT